MSAPVVWRSRVETTVVASAAEAREDLLARAGTTRIAWTVTEDPTGASASGDVIVPIRARLPVRQAALFAVTVEKPGCVVVSKRERIVVTAKPAG